MITKIRDLSHDGKGIGSLDGKTVFVENAYPEETVEIKITREKKNYSEGNTVKILGKSEDRIESICPDFYHCNGCQYCDYKYEAQLKSKVKKVKDNFRKIGKIELENIKIHGMEDYSNYRNHVQLKVKNGRIGYLDKKNNSVFKAKDCVIWPKATGKIIEVLEKYRDLDKIKLVGIRSNYKDENMLILVTEENKTLDISSIIEELKGLISHIYQNINKNPKFHYGFESTKLFGQGEFQEEILGNKFNLSPTSFFQVNRRQAEILYKKGIENLDLKKDDKVLELYSGIGSITMVIGKVAKEVRGIEYAKSSVNDAKENAKLNNMENLSFLSGRVEEKLEEFKGAYNKLLLDPPRSGADKTVIDKIIDSNFEKISYISCDPATLARDVKMLLDSGKYELKNVEIVDMFPMTSHVECVVLMSRK